MKRLVELSFRADGELDDETVAFILQRLGRSDLKRYRDALLQVLRRRSVTVSLEGGTERDVDEALRGRFPSRQVDISRDPGLGAGVRVKAGDDVQDASVMGYVRNILSQLEAP